MRVLVVGNAIDGLRFFGPFATTDAAVDYAVAERIEKPWMVAILEKTS